MNLGNWWRSRKSLLRLLQESRDYSNYAFRRARNAEQALWVLKIENLICYIETLQRVADEIDCGSQCEYLSPMDPTTGVYECPQSDRGECPFDDATELRDLANALKTYRDLPLA